MGMFPSDVQPMERVRSILTPGTGYGEILRGLTLRTGTSASAVWPAAKWILYMPFTVDRLTVITHLWWINGTVVGTDNVEMGIYNIDGTRLGTTGAVLTAGTTTPQSAALALTLGPGTYYLAITCNGVTDQFDRYPINSVENERTGGFLEEIPVAFGLPATATFATPTKLYMPLFGFSTIGAI